MYKSACCMCILRAEGGLLSHLEPLSVVCCCPLTQSHTRCQDKHACLFGGKTLSPTVNFSHCESHYIPCVHDTIPIIIIVAWCACLKHFTAKMDVFTTVWLYQFHLWNLCCTSIIIHGNQSSSLCIGVHAFTNSSHVLC